MAVIERWVREMEGEDSWKWRKKEVFGGFLESGGEQAMEGYRPFNQGLAGEWNCEAR